MLGSVAAASSSSFFSDASFASSNQLLSDRSAAGGIAEFGSLRGDGTVMFAGLPGEGSDLGGVSDPSIMPQGVWGIGNLRPVKPGQPSIGSEPGDKGTDQVVVVPLPASAGLAFAGLLGLGCIRRR
jgi:hypothetical protein